MQHLVEHHVFVYGTLKNQHLLKKVLGHDVPVKQVTTHGEKDDVRTYPNLIPEEDKAHVIKGKELTVDDTDLATLDSWEERYKRKKVKLSDSDLAYYYRLKRQFEK